MFVILFAGFLVGALRAETHEPFIADSPEQIRPLLAGAPVPDVTLVAPDRHPVVLRDALAKQPTILIYYRGGW